MSHWAKCRTSIIVASLSIVLTAVAQPLPTPARIPDGYDFGARDLFVALQRGDVVRMRRHCWNVFAGITSLTGTGLPVFMTWYTKADLFPSLGPASNEKAPVFGFEIPRQFRDFTPLPLPTAASQKPADRREENLILSKVYFNSDLRNYVVQNHLNDPKVLDRLKSRFDAKAAETEDRHIKAFPPKSVAVKTAWWIVAAGTPTLLPVWDPASNSPQALGNSPNSPDDLARWSRYVAVDVRKKLVRHNEYANIHRGTASVYARLVPLSRFFSIMLKTPDQVAEIHHLLPDLPTPKVGDYAILVGLHITTKETPNWVWATFWWQDQPDDGPFAMQRPSLVLGPWRNYLMNVSYSMNDPRESDGSTHICFNPWLEARIPGGLTSNCMTCHRLAAWPPVCQDTRRGEISSADKVFETNVKLDFLWSLTNGAQPKACATDR